MEDDTHDAFDAVPGILDRMILEPLEERRPCDTGMEDN
jgi:hypothetical protein